MSRRLAAVTLASLAPLLTGCAWLASSRPVAPAGNGPRLTHAAFVARAQAACARRSRAIAELPRPASDAQRRAFFASVASTLRTESRALAGLRPPRRDEREFARLLEASGEMAAVAARFHRAVVGDDAHARRRALADADYAGAAYDRAARRLGLPCTHA